MNSEFALLCKRCYENNEPVVDDCCVHIVDANVMMFICHNCGYEEYISEQQRFAVKRELVREKRTILKLLKLKKQPIKRTN